MDTSYVFKSGEYEGHSVVTVAYVDIDYLDLIYRKIPYIRSKIDKGLDVALKNPEKVQKLLSDPQSSIYKILPSIQQSWVEWLVLKKEKGDIEYGSKRPLVRTRNAVYKKANEEIARIEWEDGALRRELEEMLLVKVDPVASQ